MKAFILAAGQGSRLRPFTDNIPKPLLPVGGRPLMEYHLESLRKHGVTEVLINSSYLAEQVKSFAKKYQNDHPEMRLVVTYEPVLLGSAGTLKANNDFFRDDTSVLVIYGDNLTNIDYDNLVCHHQRLGGIATVAAWDEPFVESKSMMVADENLRIRQFIEKPKTDQVIVRRSGGGVYLFDSDILRFLESYDEQPLDIGFHILPHLISHARGIYEYPLTTEFLWDIGTPEAYLQAQKMVSNLEL